MISNLRITNLQSHVDTNLNFHPGVNCITGPSDAGKSGVVRSIKYVARNKPSGDSLRRHHTKKTTVELDGVTKLRTASKHQYELGGDVFKALRTNVPEEITNHLNLTDINFQEQHDAYFLIADSPGQVAKTLNKVADLEVIDLSRQSVKKQLGDVNSRKVRLDEQREMQVAKIYLLEKWVIQADEDYKVIEELQDQISKIDVDPLKHYIYRVEQLMEQVAKLPDVTDDRKSLEDTSIDVDLSLETLIDKVVSSEVKQPDVSESLYLVESLVKDLETINNDEVERLIQQVEDNLVVIPDTSKDLASVNEVVLELKIDIEPFTKNVNLAQTYSNDFDTFPKELDDPTEVMAELAQLSTSIATAEKVLCEVVIADDCVDHAMQEYTTGHNDYDSKLSKVGACPLCGGEL